MQTTISSCSHSRKRIEGVLCPNGLRNPLKTGAGAQCEVRVPESELGATAAGAYGPTEIRTFRWRWCTTRGRSGSGVGRGPSPARVPAGRTAPLRSEDGRPCRDRPAHDLGELAVAPTGSDERRFPRFKGPVDRVDRRSGTLNGLNPVENHEAQCFKGSWKVHFGLVRPHEGKWKEEPRRSSASAGRNDRLKPWKTAMKPALRGGSWRLEFVGNKSRPADGWKPAPRSSRRLHVRRLTPQGGGLEAGWRPGRGGRAVRSVAGSGPRDSLDPNTGAAETDPLGP